MALTLIKLEVLTFKNLKVQNFFNFKYRLCLSYKVSIMADNLINFHIKKTILAYPTSQNKSAAVCAPPYPAATSPQPGCWVLASGPPLTRQGEWEIGARRNWRECVRHWHYFFDFRTSAMMLHPKKMFRSVSKIWFFGDTLMLL